jgi:vacuolar-type H+-ATPase subunit H
MKEIVDRILKEEELARKKIQNARDESEGIIRKAEKESQEMIEKSVSDSNESFERKKELTRNEFVLEKEKQLKDIREKLAALRKEKEKDIPSLAQKIFSRIILIED